MREVEYVLFSSFPRALLIIAVTLWLAIASVLFSSRGEFPNPWYARAMAAFTLVVLVAWTRRSGSRLERWFFVIWLSITVLALLPLPVLPQAPAVARHAIKVLYFAAALIALRITLDIGRPFYQEARSRRIARQRGDSTGKE
jgi:hypothetical protein